MKISAFGAYSSSSNLETPMSEEIGVKSPVHPQGTKASKGKGKGRGNQKRARVETLWKKRLIYSNMLQLENYLSYKILRP